MRTIRSRGLTGSVLVLVGGSITTPLPDSLGRQIFGGLNAVAASVGGRMLGLTIAVIGLALLGWAWLGLLRSLSRSTAGEAADLRGVWGCAAAWSAPLLIAPPLFSRDGWSYAAQGVLTDLRLSPYEHGPGWIDGALVERVDPRWMFTSAPYGPIPLGWGGAGANLTHDPYLLVVWHRLAAAIGLVLLAWAVPHLARWCGQRAAVASAVVIAGPLTIAHGIGGLHNDQLAGGVAAAALALAGRWPWIAALAGGAAAAVKLPAGVVCVGVALIAAGPGATLGRRIGAFLRTAGAAALAIVLCGLPFSLGTGWVDALGVPGVIRTPLSIPTQLGRVLEAAGRLFDPDYFATWAMPFARGLGMVAAVAIVARLSLRTTTGERAAAVRAVAISAVALFWLAPAVHVWYALWVLPALAALTLSRTWFRAMVMFVLISGVSAPLDSSLEGLYASIALTTALVVGTLAPLIWRYWHSHPGAPEDPAGMTEPATASAAR